MTRLFLATALVLHLTGLPAAAGVVSAVAGTRGMTPGACCCHHASAGQSAHLPHATPVCPCSMSKDVPAPATSMPATPSSSQNPLSAFALVALPIAGPALVAAPFTLHLSITAESSPPYLTAANPRC